MADSYGWRSTKTDSSQYKNGYIYESPIKLRNSSSGAQTGGDYIVRFNPTNGQRQIYQQTAFREVFIVSINSDGSKVEGELIGGESYYRILANKENGQTKLKRIINQSNEAVDTLIANASKTEPPLLTPKQIEDLKKTKEYGSVASNPAADPPAPERDGSNPGGNPDASGPNSSNTPVGDIGPFRTVENFGTNQYNKQFLKYPTTIDNGQDYMSIEIFSYKTADVFGDGTEANINSEAVFGGTNLSSRTLGESLAQIRLPIPNNLTEANTTAWGDDSLSNLAAGLMGGAGKFVTGVSEGNVFKAGGALGETATGLMGSGSKEFAKQQLTLNAASQLIKKLGISVNAESYRARATGTVINQNLELLFNGPKLRAFQFQYKLMVRTPDEARNVRSIIKTLKKAMAPKRSVNKQDSFYLGAPDLFNIKFIHAGKISKSLPTLKSCALTNFNANYTAEGFYSVYHDGQPISVDINMTFSELTPIYSDNYDTSQDNVGFKSENLNDLDASEFAETPSDQPETPPAAATPAQRIELERQLNNPSGLVGGEGRPTDTPADIIRRGGDTRPVFTGGLRGI